MRKRAAKTSDLSARILSHIDEQELVAMARDVINIPSPTGEELRVTFVLGPFSLSS